MMFKKTKQNRVFQDMVDQIEGAILDGRLKAGDKLPSQRELGEMFQTSRGSLREALRVLEQKGLIDIKLGVSGGATVKEATTEPVSESLALLIRHQKISLHEIAEFREDVEGIVAARAAKRATRDHIQALHDLLGQAEKNLKRGSDRWEAFEEADKKIHLTIAQMAGNAIHLSVLRMVHDNIRNYFERLSLRGRAELEENYRDLVGIVRALEVADGKKARALVRNHIRKFHTLMMKEERKQGKGLS
jgi:DNA-binding FadR family transcriptional regulator